MIEGLGLPANRHVLVQLRTARSWGVPVSTIRTGHCPTDWSRVSDRVSAVALTYYEDGIHEACGHRKDRAFDPEMDGYYEVDSETVCQACAALEQWKEDSKESPHPPGTLLTIVDTRDDSTLGPLPSLALAQTAPPGEDHL